MWPPAYTDGPRRPQHQQHEQQTAQTSSAGTSLREQYLNGRTVFTASAHTVSRVHGDVLDKAAMIASLASIALQHKLVIVVPWVVVQELDGLKTAHKSKMTSNGQVGSTSFLAREAIRYFEQELGRTVNDDQILDCCLYFMEKFGLPVTILSRDRNMNVKARINGCATCGDWTGTAAGLVDAIARCSGENTSSLRRKEQVSIEPIVIPDSPPHSQPPSAQALAVPKSRLRAGTTLPTLPVISYQPPQPQSFGPSFGAASGPIDDVRDSDANSFKKQRRSGDPASFVDVEMLVTSSPKAALDPSPQPHAPIYPPVAPVATPQQHAQALSHLLHQSLHGGLQQLQQQEAAKRNSITSRTAIGVSREVTKFTYSDTCGLHQATWQDVLQRHFAPPPWRSCTVMLTIILVHWNTFKEALPYDMRDKIRSILPWVMHVEGVDTCPQTSGPLPYTTPTTEAKQMQERLDQAVGLVNTMKQLLVQCEIVESDKQTDTREKLFKEWVTWARTNASGQ
ncbi:hypothetical protein DL89DRAFT_320028 [Linderina pennispora]|uniref:PIN domain-containing protein n=1 Tax=Linderina pennispora TaxID=61395 RepID=A0A1Y1WMB4_9FUNG|nr:uncharacterized protein DL89DRAFT_320028 [Linderina pennispora]ORX74525.1 hypothetical protein DL89DRAFT_320028 [Linderina pennispora]